MMHVLIRADATPQIGGGHVMRCLTLADELAARGAAITFATRSETLATVTALAASPYRVAELTAPRADEPAEMVRASGGACDLLIVDHYGWRAEDERACRPFARRILVVDDLADRPHDCELLLDQNLGRRAGDYDGLVPSHARRLIGPTYALLRPEFARARPEALARRAQPGPVRRILVSMGLTDPRNATGLALEALAGLSDVRSGAIEVHAVLGRAAPHRAAVEALASRIGPHARVVIEPPDMAAEMVAADLCIGAGGATSWERCCLGLPTVVVVIADNQRAGAAALARAGAVLVVESGGISSAVMGLLAEPDRLCRLSAAAAMVTDGRGIERLAGRLLPGSDANGMRIVLRPVRSSDLDLTFDWQTSPGLRRFARNPNPPTRHEHETWFAQKLKSSVGEFRIIVSGGEACGVVRFDPRHSATGFEISILVAPPHQGRGVARAALGAAELLVPGEEVHACVLNANKASHRLFKACGYAIAPRACAPGETWYVKHVPHDPAAEGASG